MLILVVSKGTLKKFIILFFFFYTSVKMEHRSTVCYVLSGLQWHLLIKKISREKILSVHITAIMIVVAGLWLMKGRIHHWNIREWHKTPDMYLVIMAKWSKMGESIWQESIFLKAFLCQATWKNSQFPLCNTHKPFFFFFLSFYVFVIW